MAIPLAVTGCGDSGPGSGGGGDLDGGTQDGDPNNGGGGDGDGDTDGGILVPTPDGGTRVCHVAECQGEIRECGDCIDNDGDGLIDDDDPNCLGPCDNNESSFDLKIDGGPLSTCTRDCYFDKDSGSGNDKCSWNLGCDPLEPVTTCTNCNDTAEQDEQCAEICGPLVPAGCDCFGCCDIRTDNDPEEPHWVYIGSYDESQSGDKVGTCDMDAAKAGDDVACRPCTPLEECQNECTHECQLCLGRTVDDLPEHCFGEPEDDAGVPDEDRCNEGQQPCGLPGDDPCPNGFFCLTGCCIYAG